MDVKVKIKNGGCKHVEVECSVIEWFIIFTALRHFVSDPRNNQIDIRKAEKMLAVEPVFDDLNSNHDGCLGCKYVECKTNMEPCCSCKFAYIDKWDGGE